MPEVSDLGCRGIVLYVAKSKALISCTNTAQLVDVFVCAYPKSKLSHDAAQIHLCSDIASISENNH